MKILNIGPLELFLIVLLALVVFGPKRLVQVMRDSGKWLRSISQSPVVRELFRTTEDLRNIPNELYRESGLDQDLKEVSRALQESARIDEMNAEREKQQTNLSPSAPEEQSILPPAPPAEGPPQTTQE